MALWRWLKVTPLAQFLLAGAFIFALDRWVDGTGAKTIILDEASVGQLIATREAELARPLLPMERDQLLQAYVDNEILFREALNLGLHEGSEARKMLTRKMQYLLREDVPEPTEHELRQFHQTNTERYGQPRSIALDQIFFADGGAQRAEVALSSLKSGADPESLGDKVNFLPRSFGRASESEVAVFLGPKAAREVFSLSEDEWTGPIASQHGLHLVRVVQRFPRAGRKI